MAARPLKKIRICTASSCANAAISGRTAEVVDPERGMRVKCSAKARCSKDQLLINLHFVFHSAVWLPLRRLANGAHTVLEINSFSTMVFDGLLAKCLDSNVVWSTTGTPILINDTFRSAHLRISGLWRDLSSVNLIRG